ncbi:TPA: MFS transporter [Aeromonas salmonicida]|uniref:Major facilitator family transporter n=1 Tax=Aeromonas salmonicida (strain A449) TaxID=382245 RepID=A4SP31_AERS4|nr:MFS transporter [Aeromonas salmonicida]ABO90653.1 major facilitator family transporter [Aeromonas salmonicida subsp. salmonicida A449]AYO63648.1 MFS transporter [Aeromonas salmonicida subsp. salmonicida 01-B526]EKP0237952.1 MFS transporter [Aeromonas salmonicida]EKP0242132.1 MFS transporter [Aeromonas salmonicida]EKP0250620.1 MFS transporter [Aeromonas salmonicida]
MSLTRLLSPLASLVIFILGHGMFNTLLTVRLSAEQVSVQAIGLVSAAYFGGLVLGAFVNACLIIRVGHIRAYAAYASLLCFLFLLHGMVVEPVSWAALRLVGGFATGGLFVVLESWMLVSSSPANRGRLMSLYMILLYGSLAMGQLVLKWVDPMVLTPFALCAMVAPQPVGVIELVRLTPAGMGSSFTSGLILGAIYGLLPLYFTDSGASLSRVADMMALVILGGMCLQYPIGRISDRYDRRLVILLLSAVLTLLALLMVLLPEDWREPIAGVLVFLLGGMAFSIYPLSLSHACDELRPDQVLGANQGLLLAYSLGAMIGPLLAPFVMMQFGPQGLFVYFALCGALLTAYLGWRKRQRAPIPLAEHQVFMPVPPNTPMTAELEPRTDLEGEAVPATFATPEAEDVKAN